MDEVHRFARGKLQLTSIRSAISAVETFPWVSAKCADETQNQEGKGTAPSSLPVFLDLTPTSDLGIEYP